MPITSYGERFEDVMLYRVLHHVPVGFYIDVGANHPQRGSVTKLFYDLGWSGINIDPVPCWYAELVDARPRDVNLRVAVGATSGKTEFHEVLDTGLSTVVERHALRHQANGYRLRSYMVETRTLADICAKHVRGDIHILTIDVEGAEHAVLRGGDFRRYRPWVIVIEATEPLTDIPTYAEWEPLLLGSGYELVADDGINRFYLACEHAELRALFSIAVDDYERAASVEARTELEAIKASRAWRLLCRVRGARRRLGRAIDTASARLLGLQSSVAEFGLVEQVGVIASIGRELSASRRCQDGGESHHERNSARERRLPWSKASAGKAERCESDDAALIPRTIWQTYKTKPLPRPARLCALTWRVRNPHYAIHLCDDAELDAFFAAQPRRVQDLYRALPLGVMKADLWRICVLYEHGGIYADVDALCLEPIDRWFDECGRDAELVMGIEGSGSDWLCNWTILARPKSPILGCIRDYMIRNFEDHGIDTSDEHFVHVTTGPTAVTRAVALFLGLDEQTRAPALLELHRQGRIPHEGLRIYDESYMRRRWVKHLFGSGSFGCGYEGWTTQRRSLVDHSNLPGPCEPPVRR